MEPPAVSPHAHSHAMCKAMPLHLAADADRCIQNAALSQNDRDSVADGGAGTVTGAAAASDAEPDAGTDNKLVE